MVIPLEQSFNTSKTRTEKKKHFLTSICVIYTCRFMRGPQVIFAVWNLLRSQNWRVIKLDNLCFQRWQFGRIHCGRFQIRLKICEKMFFLVFWTSCQCKTISFFFLFKKDQLHNRFFYSLVCQLNFFFNPPPPYHLLFPLCLSVFPLLCFVAWRCVKEPWTLNSFILRRERQKQELAAAHTSTKTSWNKV